MLVLSNHVSPEAQKLPTPALLNLPAVDIKVELEAFVNTPVAALLTHPSPLTPVDQRKEIGAAVIKSQGVGFIAEVLDTVLDLDCREPLDGIRFGLAQNSCVAAVDGDLAAVILRAPVTVASVTDGTAAETILVIVYLVAVSAGAKSA